jgi:hypothetical protein
MKGRKAKKILDSRIADYEKTVQHCMNPKQYKKPGSMSGRKH